jgi:hypothetical protein
MDWARILAYVTGTVDRELLARNEYLATENRILKDQLKGRLMLSDAERATLGEIGHRLGRKVLADPIEDGIRESNAGRPPPCPPPWHHALPTAWAGGSSCPAPSGAPFQRQALRRPG